MNKVNRIMKVFYIVVFLAGIHQSVLMQMVSYAPPHEERFARRLVKAPETWEIVWTEVVRGTPSGHVSEEYEHTAKEALINYINMQFPWYRIPAKVCFHRGLILLIFGVID